MPRLPDLSVFGGRATPQSGRQISTADTSAPARAMQELGAQGMRIAGSELQGQQQERDIAKRQADAELKQRQREAAQEQKAEAAKQARRSEQIATVNAHADIQLGLNSMFDELATGVLDGKIDKVTARKTWGEKGSALVSDAIGKMPTDLQELTAAEMRRFSGGLTAKLDDVIRKNDQKTADAGLLEYREKLQRLATTDMKGAIQQWTDVAKGAGGQAGWAPDKIAKEIQSFKEGVTFTNAYDALSNAKNDRNALTAFEKSVSKLTDLDPQKKAVLLDRSAGYRFSLDQKAELAAQRAQRQAEASYKRAEAAFNAFQGMADKGTVLDPRYVDQVLAQTAGTPYQAGVKALAQQAVETGGLASRPIAEQQAILDAIDAQIAKSGRTPGLDKRRAQVETILNASNQDVDKHGLRAGVERGVIDEITPLNTTNPQAMAEGLAKRVEQAEIVGRQWAGSSVSPLLPEESEKLATELNAMKPAERSAFIASLANVVPPRQMSAISKQIDGKDRGLALAMALGSSGTISGRFVSELLIRGQQAVKDKVVRTVEESDTRKDMAEFLGDSIQGKARDDVLDAAILIRYGLESEGSNSEPDRAMRLAIGGDVIERNGRKMPIPAGIDPDKFEETAAAAASKVLAGKPVFIGGKSVPAAQFLESMPSAILEPVGRGAYVIRAGSGIVTTDGRKPLVINVTP